MKKILALALALIMLVSVMSALSVSAENIDLTPSLTYRSYEGAGFVVSGNSATLNASIKREQTNYASMDFVGEFPSKTSLNEHVTQTIKIDVMPIFDRPLYQNTYYASAYFNVLSRNYGMPTVGPLPKNRTAAECHDTIMYSIYCKDAEGNLAMQLYYMGNYPNYYVIPVPNFAEKLGEAFTLTTVWHADNKVTFICDGEELGTFDNATAAVTASLGRKEYLSIGYNGMGTARNGSNPVKLTVSDVKISHGHTAAANDADSTGDSLCTVCGMVAEHVHTPAADDGDCTTAILCTSCGEVTTPAMSSHMAAIDNFKYATETEKGYTGDVVCYLCNHEISKGEETPMLPKTSSSSSNQPANNTAIYVYIAIGAAVLVVAAVVVVLVVRKKQNRKEPKDSV